MRTSRNSWPLLCASSTHPQYRRRASVCRQSAQLPTRCKAPARCVGKRQPFSAADDGGLPPAVVGRSASHAGGQSQPPLVGPTAAVVSLALGCTAIWCTSNTQQARPRAITLSQEQRTYLQRTSGQLWPHGGTVGKHNNRWVDKQCQIVPKLIRKKQHTLALSNGAFFMWHKLAHFLAEYQ